MCGTDTEMRGWWQQEPRYRYGSACKACAELDPPWSPLRAACTSASPGPEEAWEMWKSQDGRPSAGWMGASQWTVCPARTPALLWPLDVSRYKRVGRTFQEMWPWEGDVGAVFWSGPNQGRNVIEPKSMCLMHWTLELGTEKGLLQGQAGRMGSLCAKDLNSLMVSGEEFFCFF